MSKLLKRTGIALAGLAVLIAAGWYGAAWFKTGRYLESTDDAYFKADYTTIAPKVPGYISTVPVADNQTVKQGQVLARIDDRDYAVALETAKADVASAQATIDNIEAQITMQSAVIGQAGADIASADAGLTYARADDQRYQELVREHVATTQRAEQATASLRQQAAQVDRSRAGALAARKQIDVLRSDREKAVTLLQRAEAAQQQAKLNLSYTTITAPIDGTVGARSLRVGQYVQAGTELMAVVPLRQIYVVANFKETQLTSVRAGEAASLRVDSFPNARIHGRVDSVSPASGLEFALLPPDNATGNFTKIVQRIPVKIALDPGDPLVGLLRPGMSVEATIDTKPVVMAETDRTLQLASR